MANKKFKTTVQLDSGLLIPAGAADQEVLTSDASGNATWQSPAGADSNGSMDFTTPAVDYVPTTLGAFTVCGWFTTVAAGPNQEWDLMAFAAVKGTAANYGGLEAQIIGRDNSGAALPATAVIDRADISMIATHSQFPLSTVVTRARLVLSSTFVAATLRILQQFRPDVTPHSVARDGARFLIYARRVA